MSGFHYLTCSLYDNSLHHRKCLTKNVGDASSTHTVPLGNTLTICCGNELYYYNTDKLASIPCQLTKKNFSALTNDENRCLGPS